jgi:Zn-dependent protease with chaperone function
MNFFEYQEAARRQTRWLVFYYILAVVLIVLTLYVVAGLLLHYDRFAVPGEAPHWMGLWDPALFGMVALGTGALILIGSLYKIATLASGGEAVATMLNGRPIRSDTPVLEEKRLLNVVEEMAIASGTPIPRVFVLDNESGINAFAAGFSPADAVIGVTRGALSTLNREELQGVIGHEFSHILNGDMRLNIRLIGVLNGILVIALTGYWMFRIMSQSSGRSSRDKKGNPLMVLVLLGLAMMVIGYIGVFFARLIKSAVSRQREFLADASAVQFTRNPDGLSGALKKIGGLVSGSRLQASSAEAASHLFFANGISASFLNLLATHPPLEERIRRLDPAFNPAATVVPPPLPTAGADQPYVGLSASQAVTSTGTLSAGSLSHATNMMSQIPAELMTAAHSVHDAQVILLGLLLSRETTVRDRQLELLKAAGLADLTPDVVRQTAALSLLPANSRPPLAELATATLKQMSPEHYAGFRSAVMGLVSADSEVTLFEYMVMRMMVRHLDSRFGIGRRPRPRHASLTPLTHDIEVVLSALCWFGTEAGDEASRAFAEGCGPLEGLDLRLLSTAESSLAAMDKALDRLAEATPPVKQKLIAAFTAAVSADGAVLPDEAEALRAVADALDCPIPPMVQAGP